MDFFSRTAVLYRSARLIGPAALLIFIYNAFGYESLLGVSFELFLFFHTAIVSMTIGITYGVAEVASGRRRSYLCSLVQDHLAIMAICAIHALATESEMLTLQAMLLALVCSLIGFYRARHKLLLSGRTWPASEAEYQEQVLATAPEALTIKRPTPAPKPYDKVSDVPMPILRRALLFSSLSFGLIMTSTFLFCLVVTTREQRHENSDLLLALLITPASIVQGLVLTRFLFAQNGIRPDALHKWLNPLLALSLGLIAMGLFLFDMPPVFVVTWGVVFTLTTALNARRYRRQ